MPLDGLCLSFIINEISPSLIGAKVDKIMQPSRDMFIFNLRNLGSNHRLLLSANASYARIQLSDDKYENPAEAPTICMLFRKHLIGSRIVSIEQIDFDRIINIKFECLDELGDTVYKTVVIEIMGKHSNIILINDNNIILDAIHRVNHDMSRIRLIQPGLEYQNPPMQNKLNPLKASYKELALAISGTNNKLYKLIFENIKGLAKESAKEIVFRIFGDENHILSDENKDDVAKLILDFFRDKDKLYYPNLLLDTYQTALDYFPFVYKQYNESSLQVITTISKAMDSFYTNRDLRSKMKQKSQSLNKTLTTLLQRCENRYNAILESVNGNEKLEQFKLYGKLINASLYKLAQLPKGMEFVLLTNYYSTNCEDIRIPLNHSLSPKQNADYYFKKYKKGKTAQAMADEQMQKVKSDMEFLQGALCDLENCKSILDIEDIKESLYEASFIKRDKKKKQTTQSKVIKLISPDGIIIYVGKNSIQNDRITSKAKPNETWLHVQGIPGSHVIIKNEDDIPSTTLLYAAKLAVYFSTARNSVSCMVDYTQKKHIKKPASSPAGYVRYKNFKSILVSLSQDDRANFNRI